MDYAGKVEIRSAQRTRCIRSPWPPEGATRGGIAALRYRLRQQQCWRWKPPFPHQYRREGKSLAFVKTQNGLFGS
ncbi:hypothetical protein E5288_WYG007050 [Bos mutus]|uniref:Uncharacterized protein n=1 Tax=Bos mutus TaxID=72004 RepID=A0A6B0QSJ3_9CETA|nr:hypothetical protein [Bos mutus]